MPSGSDLCQINENVGFVSFSCVSKVFLGAVLISFCFEFYSKKTEGDRKEQRKATYTHHPTSTLLTFGHIGFLGFLLSISFCCRCCCFVLIKLTGSDGVLLPRLAPSPPSPPQR